MIFGDYAKYYDLFYEKKNYRKECRYLEAVLKKYSKGKPVTILDMGCGTGNHAIPLAQRGYHVTGLDASRAMLSFAKTKTQKAGLKIDYHQGRFQKFSIPKKFDVVIAMFSVVDYLLTDHDLQATLQNVKNHLKQNSLFVFDFWNQSAVEKYFTPQKSQSFKSGSRRVIRASTTRLIPGRRHCEVHYKCRVEEKGKIVSRIDEKHVVRYFAVEEMRQFLTRAGFEVLSCHPFLSFNAAVRKNTWDAAIVARSAL